MNKPVEPSLLQPLEPFADYLKNGAARFDAQREAGPNQCGMESEERNDPRAAHQHPARLE